MGLTYVEGSCQPGVARGSAVTPLPLKINKFQRHIDEALLHLLFFSPLSVNK